MEQEITIGEFTLTLDEDDSKNIWIHHSSREGGSFDIKELEKLIRKFYNDNF
jgi:hypothetical protein